MLLNLVTKIDSISIVSCSWSNHTILLLMFVAEKVLLFLVISLTAYIQVTSWCCWNHVTDPVLLLMISLRILIIIWHKSTTRTSMARWKTAATPLLTHWSYCSLALSHRFFITNAKPKISAYLDCQIFVYGLNKIICSIQLSFFYTHLNASTVVQVWVRWSVRYFMILKTSLSLPIWLLMSYFICIHGHAAAAAVDDDDKNVFRIMSPVNSPHERPVKRGCVFASLPE